MATTTDKYILEIETAAAERGLNRVEGKMGGLGAAAGRLKGLIAPVVAGLAGMAAVKGIGDKITEWMTWPKQQETQVPQHHQKHLKDSK